MLIFKEKIEYVDPVNIIFLCGSRYDPESGKDKRIILKDFLKSNDEYCQPIILEEHFVFAKTKKGYLAYDNIFLKNLVGVEKLAALYADKIIVIHETISTAAEIGMFAGEIALTNKVGIVVPDSISIEEDKMSSFIKLAFFNIGDTSSLKPKQIIYYPDVEIYRSSKNKSEYHTFFHKNQIGENLGKQILNFIEKPKAPIKIRIKKSRYNKSSLDNCILSYGINKTNKKITAYVSAQVLKIQLLSMLKVESFRTEFRKEKRIKDHISYAEEKYKEILYETICHLEGLLFDKYSIEVRISDINSFNLRQSIGYFFYMLQATGLIGLEQISDNVEYNVRKIKISEQFDSQTAGLEGYIYEKSKTAFGGII